MSLRQLALTAALVFGGGIPWLHGQAPDLVLLNAKVFTCDAAGSIHEAIAMRDGRFTHVGSNVDIRKLASDTTQVIDLEGRLVVPGFIDTHVHPISKLFPHLLDLSDAKSIAEVRRLVAKRVSQAEDGEWVRGFGWNEERFDEGRLLTREDLDEVAAGHPVLLAKEAWHAELANSVALRLAGVTEDTEAPIGGEIVVDPETGKPTGFLKETAASLIYPFVPPQPTSSRVGLRRSCAEFLKHGVTTAFMSNEYPATVRIYQELARRESGPMARIVARPRLVVGDGSIAVLNERISGWPFVSGLGDHDVRIGELKIFVDGGVSTQSSLLWEPYTSRPDHHGIQAIPTRTLNAVVRHAHSLGWQIHFHVTGDKAVSLALDAIEAAQSASPRPDARHSLTHTYLIREQDIDRIAALKVAVVAQPNFVAAFGARFEREFGRERLDRVLPIKSLFDRGIHVAFSSDNLPVGAISAIYHAVYRVDADGREVSRQEEVTIEQAIRAFTIAGAYLSRDEANLGSIEPGKLADAVVLDRDLLTIEPREIKDCRVALTLKDGQVVYDAGDD